MIKTLRQTQSRLVTTARSQKKTIHVCDRFQRRLPAAVLHPGSAGLTLPVLMSAIRSSSQPRHHAPDAGAGDYLRPGQAYGADAAPRSPDGEGTGWWRSYWDRVSYLGSAEPSVVGAEEDDDKDKFDAAPPAVLREVRAGSWGTRTPPLGQQPASKDQDRSRAIPPQLRIKTDSPPHGHKEETGVSIAPTRSARMTTRRSLASSRHRGTRSARSTATRFVSSLLRLRHRHRSLCRHLRRT